MPLEELLPATQTELARRLAENATGAARPVCAVGGRTSLPGAAVGPQTILVGTTEIRRVVDYPARDMTITVEAGIRVSELATVLAGERQRLPVDVPQPGRATLGGAIAANASGPRRFGLGTLRDYLIGVSAVDASGRQFKAGGRVVKNVAGYDLCKMLVGSQGTLAIVTQATLKLKPFPEATRLLWCAFDHLSAVEQALSRLTTSAARPVALELLDPRAAAAMAQGGNLDLPVHRPVLCVGVEGTEREATWQVEALEAELRPAAPHSLTRVETPAADSLWSALLEFQVGTEEPLTFQASLLPSRTVEFVQRAMDRGCAVQAHTGNGIVHGHFPDTLTTAAAARGVLDELAELTARSGGHLRVERCDASWLPDCARRGSPGPAGAWMARLKSELDPRGLLNPGLIKFD